MTETPRDEQGRFRKGNTIASKHFGHSFLAGGQLPRLRGIRRIQADMDLLRKELEQSVTNLDVREKLLIAQIIKSHTFCTLFEIYIRKMGLFDPNVAKTGGLDFQGGIRNYISLQNSMRHSLRELKASMNKNNEKPETIIDVLKKERKEKEEKSNEQDVIRP